MTVQDKHGNRYELTPETTRWLIGIIILLLGNLIAVAGSWATLRADVRNGREYMIENRQEFRQLAVSADDRLNNHETRLSRLEGRQPTP